MMKMNCPRCNCVLDVVLEINAKKVESKISASKHDLLHRVATTVCNYFKISVGDLRDKSRKGVSMKRHIYFWMARKYLDEKTITQDDIASFVAKDRTSYLYGASKINGIMKDGAKFSSTYEIVMEVENAYVHDISGTVGEFEELTKKIGQPIPNLHHYKNKYIPKKNKNETTS